MNKIEQAIYNIKKLYIEKLKQDRMKLLTKIDAYEKQLSTLESINRDKSIPNEILIKTERETT